MKKLIGFFLLSLFGSGLVAQGVVPRGDVAGKVRALFWGDDDQYSEVVAVPEKWKNESAVVIYQEFKYEYSSQILPPSVDFRESTRRRIKLLDKSAVDTYSEFSFTERFKVTGAFYGKGGRVYAGVKVIKSDGKETIIDLKDAVEVKNDDQETLKKIAIPDLEVGDIIDYYYYIYEPFLSREEHVFDPIISPLSGDYPIVKQNLEFKVGKNFFINFKSLNGAPELKMKDNSARKSVVYSLTDEDRDKDEGLRWYFPRRVEPMVKFQVVYARKARLEKSADAFLGEKEKVKKRVLPSEVLSFFQKRYTFGSTARDALKYLKAKGVAQNNAQQIVRTAYYYSRFEYLIYKVEPILFIQEGFIDYLPMSYGNFLNDDQFINVFGSILKQSKIDFDVIVAVPRTISDIESLLLRDEVTTMIRVNLKEPIFVSRFGLHSTINQVPEELEGVEAYELQLDDKYRLANIKKFEMPISSYESNQTITKANVTFSEQDKSVLEYQRSFQSKGHHKLRIQNDLLYPYDYLDEEYQDFDLEGYAERADVKEKKRATIREKVLARREADKERQREAFEANALSDMDIPIKSYDGYELVNYGRFDGEDFLFRDTFQLEGLVKRAGKNYILEAGKLIGGQVALQEKEFDRNADIYMPFARSFINEINIQLPKEYGVEGIENLQKSVENETGGFVSTAKVEQGYLKIRTFKYYKNNFEKAENWPKMVDFLEASFKFTQEKVLLKKQ